MKMDKTAVLNFDDTVMEPDDSTACMAMNDPSFSRRWDWIEPVEEVIKHINQNIRI
jgi:hypothetical protein